MSDAVARCCYWVRGRSQSATTQECVADRIQAPSAVHQLVCPDYRGTVESAREYRLQETHYTTDLKVQAAAIQAYRSQSAPGRFRSPVAVPRSPQCHQPGLHLPSHKRHRYRPHEIAAASRAMARLPDSCPDELAASPPPHGTCPPAHPG